MSEKSIEQYLEDLKDINRQLQMDDVRMDDALRLYREGAAVAKKAYGLLDSYEQKIDEIEASTLAKGK